MVLVRLNTNKSLDGHKLVIHSVLPPAPGSVEAIRQQFPGLSVVAYKASATPEKDIPDEEWRDTTVLLAGRFLPDPKLVPKLQYIQILSAGANDFLDLPLFRDTQIPFCSANGVHGPQISEWVISTFLAFQHQVFKYFELQKEARWQRLSDPVEDAVGRTIGILGYGSIGRQTARVATAMGMRVHAYTLHPKDTPESRLENSYTPPGLGDPEGEFPARWFSGGSTESLHKFLSSGLDLLVVALPLTDRTRGLISAPEFGVLSQKRTFVSNIARGPIVNTSHLIEALNADVIRGAALDVTDPEPLPDGHPLWSAKNVLITPHVSGASTAYSARVFEILKLNLERLSEGRDLINKVNRKEGY